METASHLQQDPEVVAHERTYKAFNILLRWHIVVLGDLIASLVVWFVTPGGFWGALATFLIVFTLGYFFLIRHEEKQPLDVWAEGR